MGHVLWSTKQTLEKLSEGASGATSEIPYIHPFPEEKVFQWYFPNHSVPWLWIHSLQQVGFHFIHHNHIFYWTDLSFKCCIYKLEIILVQHIHCTYLYLEHPLCLALWKRASLLKWHQTPSWGWGLQPWLSKFWVRVEKEYPLIGQMAMHSFTFDQGFVSQLLSIG